MAEINNKYLNLLEEAKSKNTSSDRLKELAEPRYNSPSPFRIPPTRTPPYLLNDLAYGDQQAIRKAVICNPNTPVKTLLRLGAYFPDELLNHPAIQFLDWEDVNFLEKLPCETLATLIQRQHAPKSLLEYAVKLGFSDITKVAEMQVSISGEMNEGWHEAADKIIWKVPYEDDFTDDEQLGWLITSFDLLTNFSEFVSPRIFTSSRFLEEVAENPNTKTSTLEQLFQEQYPSGGCSIAKNPNTPIKILEFLACDREDAVRQYVAANSNTPTEILKCLAKDPNNWVRAEIGKNPKTPSNTLEILANDEFNISFCYITRSYVAKNPNTPLNTLEILANDSDIDVRRSVAENYSTPTKVLKILATDSARQNVAKNPNTPLETLELLATDSNNWTRYYVAKNPSTSVKILEILANDLDNLVLSGVAQNPNTPLELVKILAIDSSPQVRCGVAKNPYLPLNILKSLVTDSVISVRCSLTENSNIPKEILKTLIHDSDCVVREYIAKNPHTPIEILEIIARDPYYSVRVEVAKNSNMPVKILELLAKDPADEVRLFVSANPNCTLAIKEIIFKNFAKSQIPSFCRVALFLSDYAESAVLAENSNSISWLERYAIACNQKTPKSTLEQLAQDGNRIVRATAKESLQKCA